MTADTEVPPIAAMSGITIRFPGVLALDDVDFSLRPGEVHSLMGENGAGKSTLIKALTGVYPIDGGTIVVDGEPRVFSSTADAQAAGISTVYQEVNLCQNLSVGENVMLGHEVRQPRTHRLEGDARRGRAPPRQSRAAHRHPLDALQPLHRHPAARRDQPGDGHRLPRARARRADLQPRPRRGRAALRRHPRPARPRRRHPLRLALPRPGVRDLRPHHGAAQRQARRRVPRGRPDPRRAGRPDARPRARRPREHLAGRRPRDRPQRRPRCSRRPASAGAGCWSPPTSRSTTARWSASPACSAPGRTELVRLLYGADHADSGRIELRGEPARLTTPRHAIDHRIAFSSEDRRAEGIIGDLTVAENIVLGIQARRGWLRKIGRSEQDAIVAEHIASLGVRPADPSILSRNLSGGNQQKVLLARWLATAPAAAHPRRADPRHRRRRQGRHPAQGRRAGARRGSRSSSSRPSWRRSSASPSASS